MLNEWMVQFSKLSKLTLVSALLLLLPPLKELPSCQPYLRKCAKLDDKRFLDTKRTFGYL